MPEENWAGFEATYKLFNDQRPRLEAATGLPVHYSWFFPMDPQIAQVYGTAGWVVKRYSPIIRKLKQAGDALGLHIQPWRWDDGLGQWMADFGDQGWVDRCIRIGFESFHEALGERCKYFRFGDHWMNNRTLETVDRLGAKYELTLEPGQKEGHTPEIFTGSFADCSDVPRHPYRPSRSDFRRPGSSFGRRLWIIPLSAGVVDEKSDPQQYITLNLYFDSPTLCRIIDNLLAGSKKPYLALVVRADVVTRPEWYSNLSRTLDYVLNHPLAGRLAFRTPDEMIKRRN